MTNRRSTRTRPTRLDVRSADGTPLAVWVEGDGPPLVLVHGSFVDHTHFAPLIAELGAVLTTFAMDRRGFGASGDRSPYAIEREFEDVAVVVDAVAARTGQRVALWGHSFGANCALGGAALSGNVDHLVLYEPSLGITYAPGSIEAVERAVATGDVDAAISLILAEILELTAEEIEALRSTPQWSTLLAAGPTVPRECRVEDGWTYRDRQFAGISAPTLLLSGSDSPPPVIEATHRAAAAVPVARIRVLDGHSHLAHQTDPAMVAAVITTFLASG